MTANVRANVRAQFVMRAQMQDAVCELITCIAWARPVIRLFKLVTECPDTLWDCVQLIRDPHAFLRW